MPKTLDQTAEKNTVTLTDPRERFAKPPYPAQKQAPLGNSRDPEPQADYGENSYTGHGRLQGRVGLITGGDSGIGRAVALCYAKEGADTLRSH